MARGEELRPFLKTPFDGDQLSFALILDNDQLDDGGAERFAPHYNIHDTGRPFTIRYITSLPDVVISNISNRIESEEWVI